MAFCSKCGAQLGEGMKFCGSCGQNSEADGLVAQAQPKNKNKVATVEINPEESQWTTFARRVYQDIKENGKYTGRQASVTISPMFARDETRIVQSYLIEYIFTGIGDGNPAERYSPTTAAVVGAINTNSAIAYSVGGMLATKKARDNAKPHWVEAERGEVIVTDHGLIINGNHNGIVTLKYSSFLSAKMTAWNRVESEYLNSNTNKTIKVAFISAAALVFFACWCLEHHPNHPQLESIF